MIGFGDTGDADADDGDGGDDGGVDVGICCDW